MAWVRRVGEGGVKQINFRDLGGNLLRKVGCRVHTDFWGHSQPLSQGFLMHELSEFS